MTKQKWLLAGVLSLAAVGYFSWAHFTATVGEQKVQFVPSSKECFTEGGERPWKYCIYKPVDGKTNGDVAYFFHGRNQDETIWNDNSYYTAMIQAEWQARHVRPPTVVAVSFGPVWLLTKKGGGSQSGLLDVFLQYVLPAVEAKIGKPARRVLFGESMGGLNTLIAGLSAKGIFQRIVSMCPPVYQISPFSPSSVIRDFMNRTGADPKTIYGIIGLAKLFFTGESEWDLAAPLKILESIDLKSAPEIYLSCGLYDKYGNFEGAELFARRALERGLKISWRPMYGGHCVVDIPSVAEFLVR